ncbi:MAG: aldehyde dehydrogenase family protein [Chloroflexi bacterium]|nr:aldehyde dehydrogenase family protein [Chloroflexota bacterium]
MRCRALPVICVEDSIADEFIHLFTEFAKERVIGCSYDPRTELGPLVSAEHKKSVTEWIAKGVREGAELILDGRNAVVPGYEEGFFVGPTIFDHVTAEHTCGTEEVFGPVTFIKRIHDREEGIAIANGNRFANGSSIFTESGYYAREFARRIDAGVVGINVGTPVPSSFFPFSGHKQSFFGDKHVLGRDGVDFFTQIKAVTTHWYSEEEKRVTKLSTWEGMTNWR